jgi:hypothetical protein
MAASPPSSLPPRDDVFWLSDVSKESDTRKFPDLWDSYLINNWLLGGQLPRVQSLVRSGRTLVIVSSPQPMEATPPPSKKPRNQPPSEPKIQLGQGVDLNGERVFQVEDGKL